MFYPTQTHKIHNKINKINHDSINLYCINYFYPFFKLNNKMIIISKLIDHLIHYCLIVSLVSNFSGVYKNWNTILKLGFYSYIFSYLFMNFINAILLSNIAKCFPIHVLAPPLKPPKTKGCKLSHSLSHLYGLNLVGSLKYF